MPPRLPETGAEQAQGGVEEVGRLPLHLRRLCTFLCSFHQKSKFVSVPTGLLGQAPG